MLVIRLQRVGKKKQASFRVVLQEHSWAPGGKAKELLGFYNPLQKEKKFHDERVKFWLSKGAQPSPTVHNLMIDAGLLSGAKRRAWTPKKKPARPESGGDSGGEKSAETAKVETTPREGDVKAEASAKAEGKEAMVTATEETAEGKVAPPEVEEKTKAEAVPEAEIKAPKEAPKEKPARPESKGDSGGKKAEPKAEKKQPKVAPVKEKEKEATV